MKQLDGLPIGKTFDVYGEKLRYLRQVKRDYSQESLSARSKVSVSTISKIERSKVKKVRLATLKPLAEALSVDMVELQTPVISVDVPGGQQVEGLHTCQHDEHGNNKEDVMPEIEELKMKIRVLNKNQIVDYYYFMGLFLILLGFVAMLGFLCVDFSAPGMWAGRVFCAFMMLGSWLVGAMSIVASRRQDSFPSESED